MKNEYNILSFLQPFWLKHPQVSLCAIMEVGTILLREYTPFRNIDHLYVERFFKDGQFQYAYVVFLHAFVFIGVCVKSNIPIAISSYERRPLDILMDAMNMLSDTNFLPCRDVCIRFTTFILERAEEDASLQRSSELGRIWFL